MLQRTELDERVGLADQLAEEVGPVILVNTFKVAPADVEELLQAWAADAALLKSKPGFISTQLHRGIGSWRRPASRARPLHRHLSPRPPELITAGADGGRPDEPPPLTARAGRRRR
jgi:hypothetical protein